MTAATPWIGSSTDHYENFPVASWLLPRSARPPIAAVYRFARYADDVADEGSVDDETRLRELERLRIAVVSPSNDQHPLVAQIRPFFGSFGLEAQWFVDLLSAFSQDVRVKRHPDRAHLMDYCRRSADPVGKIVLQVFGRRNQTTEPLSNSICSALQLINFLQDFARDWRVGRLYIPQDELLLAGLDEKSIEEAVQLNRAPEHLRTLIKRQAQYAQNLLDSGKPLFPLVPWRLGLELRAIVAGGSRILEKLASSGFDPIASRPKLSKRDILPSLIRSLR